MAPERPADTEERLPLPDLALPEPRRRAIGDRLEAAARSRRTRHRVMIAAAGWAVVGVTVLLLVTGRTRLDPKPATTQLRTGAGDFQLLPLGDRGVAFVSEGTDLELQLGLTPTLRLHRGSVHLVIRRQEGQSFVVSTSAAEVVVLGTEFDVTVAEESTVVSVSRGEVEVRNRHGRRRLWPRESARARPDQPPRMEMPMSSVIIDGPAEIVAPKK
jgi:ferric-dicitrate binding protein FerR (iron transport regulator)